MFKLTIKIPERVIDVILVFLLFSWNIFHTFPLFLFFEQVSVSRNTSVYIQFKLQQYGKVMSVYLYIVRISLLIFLQ